MCLGANGPSKSLPVPGGNLEGGGSSRERVGKKRRARQAKGVLWLHFVGGNGADELCAGQEKDCTGKNFITVGVTGREAEAKCPQNR